MTIKPGDTVDPRTLPVGAVFCYVGFDTQRRVTRPGYHVPVELPDCELATATGVEARAIIISLPPADEPVELGTLKVNAWFEFARALPGLWQVDNIGMTQVRCVSRDGVAAMFHSSSRVLRRPAPTAQPTKRPPCDACGEESKPYRSTQAHYTCVLPGEEVRLCDSCARRPAPENRERVLARRAKTSSGSEKAVTQKDATAEQRSGNAAALQPEELRWPNTTPDRIPALEATLAAQVAAGGVDTEYTRGRIVAGEVALRELDRPSKPMSERYLMPGGFQKIKGTFGGIQPGPLLHRSELPLEQKALWRRR